MRALARGSPRSRRCRSAFIFTCRFAGSAATSATSAFTPTRTRRRSPTISTPAFAELEIYARSPLINGRKPKFVYFGGGTPSYLSVKQLKSLTDRMKALLPWDEAEEVTFEASPAR